MRIMPLTRVRQSRVVGDRAGRSAIALLFALALTATAGGQSASRPWRSSFDARGIPGTLIVCGSDVAPGDLVPLAAGGGERTRRAVLIGIGVPSSWGAGAKDLQARLQPDALHWGRTLADLRLPAAAVETADRRTVFWIVAAENGLSAANTLDAAPDFGSAASIASAEHLDAAHESRLWTQLHAALRRGATVVIAEPSLIAACFEAATGSSAAAATARPGGRTETGDGRKTTARSATDERLELDAGPGGAGADREPAAGPLVPGVIGSPAGADDSAESSSAALPGVVSLTLEPRGVLRFAGRQVTAIGDAPAATLRLAAGAGRDVAVLAIDREHPADLTQLRRAAESRLRAPFPPPVVPVPQAPHGSLLIVGGGGFPDEMVRLFVEQAGGPEARIVVVAGAEESPRRTDRSDVRRFLEAGAARVDLLEPHDPARPPTARELAPLREATGIWFGGGRQWRLVDAYEGTPFLPLCRAALRRGGIIGGSSAGATIQGDYLVRGHPLGNAEMMAEGYERGFAFLPGTAIDQHFTQRRREPELAAVKRTFPQLVCVGIDESTALFVHGESGRVLGSGTVSIYDRRPAEVTDGTPDGIAARTVLGAGDRYDFRRRVVMQPVAD